MEKNAQEMHKLMKELRDWINRQSHLPKDLEDKMLKRFLHSCYYDIDATKDTLELFFSIRVSAPEIVNFRDPDSLEMQKMLKIVNLAHYKISNNRNMWIWQLNDPGCENYDYLQDARLFFMTLDTWLLNNEEYAESDVVIMDVKDVTLKVLPKLNLSVVKKFSKYQVDATPIRLKEAHIVNSPPFIDKLYALVKPLLNPKVTELINFHPNSQTLLDKFSKEDLPEDYGGSRPSMAEHMKNAVEAIMKHKNTFLQENFWKSEKKSKGIVEPSFRSLDID